MEIKYDIPFEVTKEQHDVLINHFAGVVCGREDKDGKFWIKVWIMGYKKQIIEYLTKK